MLSRENKELCNLFASIVNYPDSARPAAARDCALHLHDTHPNIARKMRAFADFVNSQSLEALEELYTQTFDISPAASLYLGYQLFGDTPKRSEFLIRMSDAYKEHSLSTGTELADHLSLMLRYLSVSKDHDFAMPLIEDCLLPTLEKTGKELKKIDSRYALVIEPLAEFLKQISQEAAKTGGVPNA